MLLGVFFFLVNASGSLCFPVVLYLKFSSYSNFRKANCIGILGYRCKYDIICILLRFKKKKIILLDKLMDYGMCSKK